MTEDIRTSFKGRKEELSDIQRLFFCFYNLFRPNLYPNLITKYVLFNLHPRCAFPKEEEIICYSILHNFLFTSTACTMYCKQEITLFCPPPPINWFATNNYFLLQVGVLKLEERLGGNRKICNILSSSNSNFSSSWINVVWLQYMYIYLKRMAYIVLVFL